MLCKIQKSRVVPYTALEQEDCFDVAVPEVLSQTIMM